MIGGLRRWGGLPKRLVRELQALEGGEVGDPRSL